MSKNLINKTLLCCAQLVEYNYVSKSPHSLSLTEYRKKIEPLSELSQTVFDFFLMAINLILISYPPNFIRIKLDRAFHVTLHNSQLSDEEIETLVILKNIVIRSVMMFDIAFFKDYCANEISGDFINEISGNFVIDDINKILES